MIGEKLLRALVLAGLASVLLMTTGCVYRAGSSQLYEAKSETAEGQRFIGQNNIKYFCREVWSLYWADATRGKCSFVAVSDEKARIILGGTRFNAAQVRQPVVERLQLKPAPSIWQRYGFVLALLIGGAVFAIRLAGVMPR